MTPDNLTTWQELEALKLGTLNQRERWLAKLLPEDELLALARTALFAPLGEFKRWSNKRDLRAGDLTHTASCPELVYPAHERSVRFETVPAVELGADEWDVLKAIQHAAQRIGAHPWLEHTKAAAAVESREHRATCEKCGAQAFRAVALVSVPWAGRTLTREYVLVRPGS